MTLSKQCDLRIKTLSIGSVLLIVLLLPINSLVLFAIDFDESRWDSIPVSVADSFSVYYRWDKYNIDQNYLDNEQQLLRIDKYLAGATVIDSIVIQAYASPEGGYRHNLRLARRRAEALRNYLLSKYADSIPVIDQSKIRLLPLGENWDGLYKEVQEYYYRHDRAKVLRILEDNSVGNETKKWRLQQLDKGYTYRYLITHLMPRLRTAIQICFYEPPFPILNGKPFAYFDDKLPIDTIIGPEEIKPIQPREKVTIAAIKTNLLYDAVSAVNFEVEVPIGNKWSVMAENVCPWWTWGRNKNQYAFQMWEIGVEPRWWFARDSKRDKLSGQFLGAYLMSSIFDFQNDFALCYQGEYWSTGLSYGFSMPLGRRLNLELSASVGYLRADYRHYQPDPAYEHLYRDIFKTGVTSYFGPTKLKASIVLPLRIWRTVK